MKRATLLSLITGLGAVAQAQAQQVGSSPAAETEAGPWTGKAALGYLATSGNTESSSLNSSFAVAYAINRWTHELMASAISASENEQTSAEAYAVGWKTEFNMTERDFLFGRVNWRKDRFSGYEQQLTESMGYGRRIVDTGTHSLNAEIGVGARQADLTDGSSEQDLIARGGINYRWQFSENAQFTQDFNAESGSDNTYAESISAIKTRLVGALAMVASYTVKNNSVAPAGAENTDTFAALSLEYAF